MESVNIVFGMLILFAVLSMLRARGMGSRYRRLQDEIGQLRAAQAAPPPQRGPTTGQMQMLEDRVRVLERIVTDQNYSLARDIEALRDPRDARQTEEKI